MQHLLKPLRVLHVEDSEDDSALIMRELRRGGYEPICQRVDTQSAFIEAFRSKDWDVVISDYSLPRYDGPTALADARQLGKDIPFVIVSGTIGEDVAVRAMRAGAQDYVLKHALGRLPLVVEREMREAAGRAKQRAMAEQLAISERMASAGMLAAGVAHEINNPLAVVMANLEFITGVLRELEPDIDPDRPSGAERSVPADLDTRLQLVAEPLQDARQAVERMRGIVRDLRLFSRAHDDVRENVDVHAVIESTLRLAWNEIRHRAQIVRDYCDTPLVDSNAARLGQILLNLFVNAAQSMPVGRVSENTLRVTTKKDGQDWLLVEVSDTGTGMPEDVLARVFDPFFTTKEPGSGTGLGLSLCHRMVTDLGGAISVESQVGRGSSFRLRLPVATRAARIPVQKWASTIPPRRSRILVVDDEVAIGRILERGLGPHHDVVVCMRGEDALRRIAAGERFDAILCDLMMPEVTGMDIYLELSKSAPDQAERMVFLTGGAFTDRGREFLDGVPNKRIDKPFLMANVLTVLGEVVSTDVA